MRCHLLAQELSHDESNFIQIRKNEQLHENCQICIDSSQAALCDRLGAPISGASPTMKNSVAPSQNSEPYTLRSGAVEVKRPVAKWIVRGDALSCVSRLDDLGLVKSTRTEEPSYGRSISTRRLKSMMSTPHWRNSRLVVQLAGFPAHKSRS